MTFHGRLRLFFAIIVIIPMLAIAAVLFSLTADSERGKADAGIATGLSVALSLYGEGRTAAAAHLKRIAADDALQRALSTDDRTAARDRLRRLVARRRAIVSATLTAAEGDLIARAGSGRGVAPASAFLEEEAAGTRLGSLAVSVTDARRLARSAAKRTKLDFVLLRGGRVVATTVPGVVSIPRAGDFDAGGRDYRGRRLSVGRPGGVREEIGAFTQAGDVNADISASRLLIGAIIVAFLLLALAFSVVVVRELQGQVGKFLEAARRLAGGRFDQPVPIEGNDEFAQLGHEFNNMSKQLAQNIREVERKRVEMEDTIRQIGKGMASGLDRQGIYDLTAQAAVRACEAEAGRAMPLDVRIVAQARSGSSDPALASALEAAERAAFAIGPDVARDLLGPPRTSTTRSNGRRPASVSRDGVHALALPLNARIGAQTYFTQVGVVSIARRGEPFGNRETEMLEYLGDQAAVSLENVDLHETVQQQAITDELTGLSNLREMRSALDREFDRRSRFDTPLALVTLDIDDFKDVNDRYGHQQGDEVLREVARVLRELTRDVDEPVRSGGEEFAVVLPQTDREGARQLAERVREEVEALQIPRMNGDGTLRVTASFGVAAVPASAADKEGLLRAADEALYRAKRAGKNRVECAPDLQ